MNLTEQLTALAAELPARNLALNAAKIAAGEIAAKLERKRAQVAIARRALEARQASIAKIAAAHRAERATILPAGRALEIRNERETWERLCNQAAGQLKRREAELDRLELADDSARFDRDLAAASVADAERASLSLAAQEIAQDAIAPQADTQAAPAEIAPQEAAQDALDADAIAEIQAEILELREEIADREAAQDKAAGLVSWLINCNDPCSRLPAAQAELEEADLFLAETKRELGQAAAKLAAAGHKDPHDPERPLAIAHELDRDAAGTERTAAEILARVKAGQAEILRIAQAEHDRQVRIAADYRRQAKEIRAANAGRS